MADREQVPAIEGWFTTGPEPQLLGTQCSGCKTYFFPKEMSFCRNPGCVSGELDEVPLSQRGRLWSFTNNCYPPPGPYIAAEPFEPYAIAAVEPEKVKMVILGQVVPEVKIDDLEAGMEMELVAGTLYEDDDNSYMIWKWSPVAHPE